VFLTAVDGVVRKIAREWRNDIEMDLANDMVVVVRCC